MDERLNTIVPESEHEPYDMREVIEAVFDRDSFLEIHPYFARNVIVGFARLDGYCVGIVANQPSHLAGALDIDSSDKIARFVSTCDAFNIPLVTFVDTPGYLPGRRPGALRHHPPRLQGHLRVLPGDGAEDHDRDPQGDGRRVRRDVLEADAQRPRVRVADARDRGDGGERRRARAAPSASWRGDGGRRRGNGSSSPSTTTAS